MMLWIELLVKWYGLLLVSLKKKNENDIEMCVKKQVELEELFDQSTYLG